MNKKKILKYLVIVAILGVVCVWSFVFYLPKKDWWNDLWIKKGGYFTAIQIVKDFQANEDSAYKKYPDKKTIEVTGIVKEAKIQDGKSYITLQSSDSTVGVYFVLKDSTATLKVGEEANLKGICTGFSGDVQFNEGVIIKK